MIAQFASPQFRRFLLTGGLAALVNLGSRALYDIWLSYSIAIALAYATGMVTAYVLARRFVFVHATRDSIGSAPRFVAVNALGVAQTWAVSVLLAHFLLPAVGIVRYAETLAHLVGVVVPVFTSYLGHRMWTFKDQEPVPEQSASLPHR